MMLVGPSSWTAIWSGYDTQVLSVEIDHGRLRVVIRASTRPAIEFLATDVSEFTDTGLRLTDAIVQVTESGATSSPHQTLGLLRLPPRQPQSSQHHEVTDPDLATLSMHFRASSFTICPRVRA